MYAIQILRARALAISVSCWLFVTDEISERRRSIDRNRRGDVCWRSDDSRAPRTRADSSSSPSSPPPPLQPPASATVARVYLERRLLFCVTKCCGLHRLAVEMFTICVRKFNFTTDNTKQPFNLHIQLLAVDIESLYQNTVYMERCATDGRKLVQ